MNSKNWLVEWTSSTGTNESRYFEERMAAQRFADSMESRNPNLRTRVSFLGQSNFSTATLAIGPL